MKPAVLITIVMGAGILANLAVYIVKDNKVRNTCPEFHVGPGAEFDDCTRACPLSYGGEPWSPGVRCTTRCTKRFAEATHREYYVVNACADCDNGAHLWGPKSHSQRYLSGCALEKIASDANEFRALKEKLSQRGGANQ